MYADHIKVNQVLRLRIGAETYKGLIVNLTDDVMLVATTSTVKPDMGLDPLVHGEIFTTEGLFNFTSHLKSVQMTPVMVFIMDRPRAMRRVQRRREERKDVNMAGLLVFISADRSINARVDVSNLSFGGAEVLAPEAPPEGMHCMLLFRSEDFELSTIVRVVHADPIEGGYRLGLAFVEMSRTDWESLRRLVALLN